MLIGIPKELNSDEKRVAIVPKDVGRLVRLGADVQIEKEIGLRAGFSDEEYLEAGVSIAGNRDELLKTSDIILRVRTRSDSGFGS